MCIRRKPAPCCTLRGICVRACVRVLGSLLDLRAGACCLLMRFVAILLIRRTPSESKGVTCRRPARDRVMGADSGRVSCETHKHSLARAHSHTHAYILSPSSCGLPANASLLSTPLHFPYVLCPACVQYRFTVIFCGHGPSGGETL